MQFGQSVARWFRSVVVITSALHAEGREFEPRRNLKLFWCAVYTIIFHDAKSIITNYD